MKLGEYQINLKDKIKRRILPKLEYTVEVRLNEYQLLQFKGKEKVNQYRQYLMSAILS